MKWNRSAKAEGAWTRQKHRHVKTRYGACMVSALVVHAKPDSTAHARNQLSCARGCWCSSDGDDGDDGDDDHDDDEGDDDDDDDDDHGDGS